MAEKTAEALKQDAQRFPRTPGVYLMKDREGKILYIGKAKDLKKRVVSYFTGSRDVKTRFLVGKIASIEHIVTKNEYEALLLENNLIKQWTPHYNVNLKDGKTYPVIRITNEEFPRVFRTRRIIDDGSTYYGPYTDVQRVDLYLEIIEKLFPLRKCRGPLKKRTSPCLYYHMHRCSAPCAGMISQEDYAGIVEQVKKLFAGKTGELKKELEEKMETAAESLEFEKAAAYRDSIQAVEWSSLKQEVVDLNGYDRDYAVIVSEGTLCTFALFQMREGRLTGQDLFYSDTYESEEEALSHFLLQYYSPDSKPPRTIYLSVELDTGELEEYFREELGVSTEIKVPVKGKHLSLIRMAEENARIDLRRRMENAGRHPGLEEIRKILHLEGLPQRIEGFDIAQLSGTNPVASMVSFLDGKPDKQQYRKYHIRSLNGQIDDFKSIREVVARRYTRLVTEQKELPDLILIDGGKGQVSSAQSVLRSLGITSVPVIGLAKRIEEIVPVEGAPFTLPDTSPALRLLQFIRDEAHRFATTFQKSMRQKKLDTPVLTQIKGIGEKRARQLMSTYGSFRTIASLTPGEIAGTVKIPCELAEKVIELSREMEKPLA